MILILVLTIFVFFISGLPPKIKRAVSYVLGVGWLALLTSNYGILAGWATMYYPGKFTQSGKPFETVKWKYWIGFGSRSVITAGPPGSMSCPWSLHLENKWKSPKILNGEPPATSGKN